LRCNQQWERTASTLEYDIVILAERQRRGSEASPQTDKETESQTPPKEEENGTVLFRC